MKIFLGIPVYRELDASFAASLLGLLTQPPAGLEFTVHLLPGDSLVCRARNTLTARFLAGDCTHLLWLDSDLVFSSEMIARLCSHDVPLVAGLYPKKTDTDGTVDWCLNSLPDAKPDARGLLPVRYAGTGAMLIAREVFGRLGAAGLAPEFSPDEAPETRHFDFWRVGVEPWAPAGKVRRYLSEDWFFCELCRAVDVPVLVDTHTVFKHLGWAAYPTPRQESALAAGLCRAAAGAARCVVSGPMLPHAEHVLRGEYESPLSRPPVSVLDLGANEGSFTAWARAQWPQARIEAYEPMPESADLFRRNHGHDPLVRLTQAAVGSAVELYRGRNNSGEASAYHGAEQGNEIVPVASVLPQTVPACEFIKVDCEGMELEILTGLDLSAALGVAVEYHTAVDGLALRQFMASQGFEFQGQRIYSPERGILIFTRKP